MLGWFLLIWIFIYLHIPKWQNREISSDEVAFRLYFWIQKNWGRWRLSFSNFSNPFSLFILTHVNTAKMSITLLVYEWSTIASNRIKFKIVKTFRLWSFIFFNFSSLRKEDGWGMQIFEAHFSNRWFTSKGLMDSVRTHRWSHKQVHCNWFH